MFGSHSPRKLLALNFVQLPLSAIGILAVVGYLAKGKESAAPPAVAVQVAAPVPANVPIQAVNELPTKEKWLQGATGAAAQPGLVQAGTLVARRDRLYAAVGSPSSVSYQDNDAYLYWDCADGRIQVITGRYMLDAQGVVQGTVNAY